jgi:peptide/nickel transport system ATP-binding protein/oligopeptide transport system ATP-binding protein
VVKHIADRVAVMYLGRIVEGGSADAVFAAPRHPYTRALLSAIPIPHPQARRERIVLAGDVPSPLAPPAGCHLHLRCPYAAEICRRERPPLATEGGQATACHRWRELPPATAALGEAERSPSVERLVALYARGADVRTPPGVGTVVPDLQN